MIDFRVFTPTDHPVVKHLLVEGFYTVGEINIHKLIETDIIQSQSLEKSDQFYLESMFESEFGHIDIAFAEPSWYLIAKYDGVIIGRIGIIKRAVKVENELINVGGISGVVLLKNWRGKNVSKLIIDEAANFIKSYLKLDFGLLLCRDEVIAVYKKCNWNVIDEITSFSQTTGEKIYPRNTMVIELSNKRWPKGTINLNGLPW